MSCSNSCGRSTNGYYPTCCQACDGHGHTGDCNRRNPRYVETLVYSPALPSNRSVVLIGSFNLITVLTEINARLKNLNPTQIVDPHGKGFHTELVSDSADPGKTTVYDSIHGSNVDLSDINNWSVIGGAFVFRIRSTVRKNLHITVAYNRSKMTKSHVDQFREFVSQTIGMPLHN